MTRLLLAFVATLFATGVLAAPIPVILDTDIGDDIDDTWALAYMLGSPQFDVKLIVTAVDDTAAKTRLVAKLLDKMGKTTIPIATGLKTSDQTLHQAKWLGEYTLKTYPGKIHEDGVQVLVDTIKGSKSPMTLVVIGPQTNIREALKRDPSIASNARVVTMAGSVYIGYDGAPKPQPEYNVFKDVEAAKAVFAAPWEITMAPLDICGTLRLGGEPYKKLVDSKHRRAEAVIENYDAWSNRSKHPADGSSVLFDTAAIYLAMDESLAEIQTVKLKVDDKGNTVPDEAGRPVRCALKWKDRAAFEGQLVHALTE
jgi:inosine-uridine nucleoside N-ribohydrolase